MKGRLVRTLPNARPPRGFPRVVVELEIEAQVPRLTLHTETHEDELALRRWLRSRPTALAVFADLTGFLDELDRLDSEAA